MTTLLLDADIIAFKLAATSQRSYKWPGQEAPSVAADDFDTLPERIDAEVSELCKKLASSEVIVCLSCPTEKNFRMDVLPSYKANRSYDQRPVHLAAVKEYLEKTYPSYRRDRLEADDIMGILSTHPKLVSGKKVIVSEDKDMQTIPGWLFNPAKDKAPRLIPQHDADYWHLYQTLVGDTTDGYKGCPKVGPVGASKLLTDGEHRHLSVGEMWARVVAAFEARGLAEEDALVQARVARILRHTDYDFKNKEVILWTPASPLPLTPPRTA